jgi:hypothetical protein
MTSDEFAKILYLGVEIGWSGLCLKVVLSGKLSISVGWKYRFPFMEVSALTALLSRFTTFLRPASTYLPSSIKDRRFQVAA